MRKPRQHPWLTLSVVMIAYSVFQVVVCNPFESAGNPDKLLEPIKPHMPEHTKTTNSLKESGVASIGTKEDRSNAIDSKKSLMESEIELEEGEKKKQKDDVEEAVVIRENEKVEDNEDAIPTLRPPRTCTPPAIEQFPRPLMGQSLRKHGGLILHILVAVFTFIGLKIVCDEYFVSSLYRICEELQLAPDVAGATLMAAGSSAPELATVVIGVFCAKDDIGVSGVIGSAVFNIMFVISVCALCAGTVSHLNWWPLCRDCFFYAVSILVMLCTIANGYVSWLEALSMLTMYGVYCVALRFDNVLKRWAFKLPSRKEQAAFVTYKSGGGQPATAPETERQYTQTEGQNNDLLQKSVYYSEGAYVNVQPWDPNNAWDETSLQKSPEPAQSWREVELQQEQTLSQDQTQAAQEGQVAPASQPPAQPTFYKAKDYNLATTIDPLVKPIGANPLQLACWYVAFPVHWSCRHTMPDCRGRWYPVTFINSMLWISFYSYFMVWMITIIGYTLGIPDTVMGLTFVAAGVSVPDALCSLAVIKKGYGDMAVSNVVGSNVFNILVCLGLPWFIQTAIMQPGGHVNVISKGLIYSTLSLFSTVVFIMVAIHVNGRTLDRKLGLVLMAWYLFFIILASLYELNVFGNIHPLICETFY